MPRVPVGCRSAGLRCRRRRATRRGGGCGVGGCGGEVGGVQVGAQPDEPWRGGASGGRRRRGRRRVRPPPRAAPGCRRAVRQGRGPTATGAAAPATDAPAPRCGRRTAPTVAATAGVRSVVRPATCSRPCVVGAAEQQHPRRVDGAEDAGDDGFAGEPGAEFLPAPHPGPVRAGRRVWRRPLRCPELLCPPSQVRATAGSVVVGVSTTPGGSPLARSFSRAARRSR